MIGPPAVGDVQFLLSLKEAKVDSAGALLRVRRSQRSRFYPVLSDQGSADQATAQQREEERREDGTPPKHGRHPWITGRTSLGIVRDHLSLILDEVHLAEAPRKLALLDLLRKVLIFGEFYSTRFPGPEERRGGRSRSLGKGIRYGVWLGYVKVNRPVILMEMGLNEATVVRRIAAVHARCSVAVRVRARVVDPVVVRRVS